RGHGEVEAADEDDERLAGGREAHERGQQEERCDVGGQQEVGPVDTPRDEQRDRGSIGERRTTLTARERAQRYQQGAGSCSHSVSSCLSQRPRWNSRRTRVLA